MGDPRHFLDLDRLDAATLRGILDQGLACKRDGAAVAGSRPLAGKALAMIFEKPSTRTRVSFERGIQQLGGEAIVLEPSGSQIIFFDPEEDYSEAEAARDSQTPRVFRELTEVERRGERPA